MFVFESFQKGAVLSDLVHRISVCLKGEVLPGEKTLAAAPRKSQENCSQRASGTAKNCKLLA